MKKLRLGIIGTGGIARACHIQPLLKNPEIEVVAVCDIVEAKLAQFAKEFGIKDTYLHYRDLLDRGDIDAVDICTPNYLHSTIAVDALKKGKHVFTEKPDAVSVEEVMKMQKTAAESGKILMVMRNNRYRPDTQFLKKYITTGHLGQIYAAKCGWIRRRGIPGAGGWFTTKAQSGGGPLIDLGVHMIDVTMWMMGSPRPVSVVGSSFSKFSQNTATPDSVHSGFGEKKAGGIFDVEDMAMGFIKFDNGACLSIEFSWASNVENEDAYFELLGDKAGAKSHWGAPLKIFSETNGTLIDSTPLLPNTNPEIGQHGLNLYHFANCVLHGEAPDFVPQQGVDMIKILTAIYKSAETGKEITLEK